MRLGGRLPLYVTLLAAIAAALVPWHVCIPSDGGAASQQLAGNHGHDGHSDEPANDHQCCSHVSMDVGVPFVATTLDVPVAVDLAPPPAAERAAPEFKVARMARVPCEEDSVVLLR